MWMMNFFQIQKKIENIQCSTTITTNVIVCESTDLNIELCPVETTGINQPSTRQQASEENPTEPQSRSSQVHVTSLVVTVVIIFIIILSFVLIIRRIKGRHFLKHSKNRDTDNYDDASSTKVTSHIRRHHHEDNELYQSSQSLSHQISDNIAAVNTNDANFYCEIINE